MSTEPHAVILSFGSCPECEASGLSVVAIPRLSTGELYPMLAACEACGARFDLDGSPPIQPMSPDEPMRLEMELTYRRLP
jgi:hypothetical protein